MIITEVKANIEMIKIKEMIGVEVKNTIDINF